jgi:hypothetical protein
MRIAILVQGRWRTGALCWPKIVVGFQEYQPDIFYLSHEPENEAEIQAVMRPTELWFPPDDPQPECDYAANLGDGVKSPQTDLRQLADLFALAEYIKKTGIHYDWLVRTRTDLDMVILPEPLDLLEADAVYIPCHDNWAIAKGLPGLNDRFAFGPPDLMRVVLARYHRLPEFWQQHHLFHMETFLAWALRDTPVKRTRTTFGLWRNGNERLAPYVSPAWGDVHCPLKLNQN